MLPLNTHQNLVPVGGCHQPFLVGAGSHITHQLQSHDNII